MVHFVLDYLGGPAGKAAIFLAEFFIQVLHLDIFISGAGTDAGEGQAAFFCGKFPGLADNFRIYHGEIAFAICHHDDIFQAADHIGCHANALVGIGFQGIQQILGDWQIIPCGISRRLGKKDRVVYNGLYHKIPSFRYGINYQKYLVKAPCLHYSC